MAQYPMSCIGVNGILNVPLFQLRLRDGWTWPGCPRTNGARRLKNEITLRRNNPLPTVTQESPDVTVSL
ncbi:MAG: hypothetical protein E3J46_09335 [Desulfobacteraceae bacterium]|nr:MAG: hypothetical protein E3J46_09335 [Desulfobacteraceae bacterium]